MPDITLNGVGYPLDGGHGSHSKQDITPTFVQATEGAAGDTDVQPFAEQVYTNLGGSHGLLERTLAPGDLTRTFLCDADNTRPNQLTAWLQWPAGTTVAIDVNPSSYYPYYMASLVNDGTAWGFTSSDGFSRYMYHRWNGTKFAIQANAPYGVAGNQTTSRIPSASNVYLNGIFPQPIVQMTGTNLWSPQASGATKGLTDISVAPVAPVYAQVGISHTFVYFDILFSIQLTAGNLVITPFRPNTPIVGNIVNAITINGLAVATATIPGESVCMGVATCEGAVYIATERSIYAMQWNDTANSILTTKLLEFPRITSAPYVWNGEVYIGVDNRVVHITPGQRGYDFKYPDVYGVLPTPWSGTVVSMTPTPDALYVQVVDAAGATFSQGWCLLRLDPNGAWTTVFVNNPGTTNQLPLGPMVPIVDGTNPFGLAYFNFNATGNPGSNPAFPTATILNLPQVGRNPSTLATTQRLQRAGPFRAISPWEYGANRTSSKQLMRYRIESQGAQPTGSIKVYYQLDSADRSADTFTTGDGKGTGAWTKVGQVQASSAGSTGTIDSGGNGAIWYEFDGATSYNATVGVLASYPQFRRIRWMVELNGDTSGTYVPTFLGLAWQRLEYPWKFYLHSVRLRVSMDDRVSGESGTTALYNSYTDVKTALDTLEALASAKSIISFTDATGNTVKVVVSKIITSIVTKDDMGVREAMIDLSLQDIPLMGQV